MPPWEGPPPQSTRHHPEQWKQQHPSLRKESSSKEWPVYKFHIRKKHQKKKLSLRKCVMCNTSALKSLGNWSLAFHNMSISSRFTINILDLIKAVLNVTRNIISSRSMSSFKQTHSTTTSPWIWQLMSILTNSHSACNTIQVPNSHNNIKIRPSLCKKN